MIGSNLQRDILEPAEYSLEECRFLLQHIGEPAIVAVDGGVPIGVNEVQVRPLLGRVYELEELRKHKAHAWAGIEAVKTAFAKFLQWMDTTAEIQRRGGPKHVSMYGVDGAGRLFKYAIGSDSGMVRSAITGRNGTRERFAVELTRPDGQILPSLDDIAPWLQGDPERFAGDKVEEDWGQKKGKKFLSPNGTIRCTICGRSETFRTDNHASYNAARARLIRHLKNAKEEIDRHLILHQTYSTGPGTSV